MSLAPQYALELMLSNEPCLERFIVGRNVEAMTQLRRLVDGEPLPMMLYLWGVGGAGKSHILRSLAVSNQARWLTHEDLDRPIYLDEHRWWLVDDVDELNRNQQKHLFHLFNELRAQPIEEHRHLIVTSICSPQHLPTDFLPDLRTRLGWDLVYELHALVDEEKARVLTEQAAQRGLTLGNGVIDYMLRYSSRDLSKLHAFLIQLDAYSLRKQQAVTIPLLKEWLQTQRENDA